MTLVEIATQPWGVATKRMAMAVTRAYLAPNENVPLVLHELDGTTPATIYAGDDELGPTLTGAQLETGADGVWPGWIEVGRYLLTEPGDGTVRQVEAITGLDSARLESVESGGFVEAHRPFVNAAAAPFNADKTGTSDATADLDDALAAGATVWLADGEYKVEGLDVPVDTRLTGTKAATLKRTAGATTTYCIHLAAGASLDGVKVDGNEPNLTNVSNTIELGGSRASVGDVEVFDSPYDAIAVLSGADQTKVDGARVYKVNSTYSAGRFGVNLLDDGSSGANAPVGTLVTNCHIQDTEASNISIHAGKWTTISDNVCERSGTNGDGVASYPAWNEHTLIANNTFRDNDNHFVHAGGDYVTIVGNHGENAGTEGYVVASDPNSDPTASVGCHLSGNTGVTTRTLGGGSSGAMIRVQRYTDVEIGPGLNKAANTQGMNVIDCVDVSIYPGLVKGCVSHGIRLAGCVDVSINGGVVRSNGGNGVSMGNFTRPDATVVETVGVEINGTLIKGNTGWGVRADNSTSNVTVDAPIRGNTAGNVSLIPNRTTHHVVPGKSDTTANLASIAALVLSPDRNFFNVTGTTPITSITSSWSGRVVFLKFATGAANMLVDGSNLKLGGSLSPDADDVVALVCDGTNWHQAAPLSVN